MKNSKLGNNNNNNEYIGLSDIDYNKDTYI